MIDWTVISVLISIFGIIIGLGVYFLQYRKTIGRDKQKTNDVNRDIVKWLFRLMVLERYKITLSVIEKMIKFKSHERSISYNNLPSPKYYLEVVAGLVLENEIIPPDAKKKIVEKIDSVILMIKKPKPRPKPSSDRFMILSSVIVALFPLSTFYFFLDKVIITDLIMILPLIIMMLTIVMSMIISIDIFKKTKKDTISIITVEGEKPILGEKRNKK